MSKPTISIIVAIAGEKRVIGKNGGLPWYIPAELKHFKELTIGHPIIMGRKTHESIGRALPNRLNIVITRDEGYKSEGVKVVNSLEKALEMAKANKVDKTDEIFIIGGGEIYKQALPLVDKLYLTIVEEEVEGDVFFPDYSDFKHRKETGFGSHEGIKYTFWELTR